MTLRVLGGDGGESNSPSRDPPGSGGCNAVIPVRVKIIGHGVRWVLTLALIWLLAFPETGFWTCVILTLIAAETEWDHLDPRDWSKI